MSHTTEKARLRKQLLNQRDSISPNFIDIASGKIQENLRRVEYYRNAKTIGAYHALGSEVRTLNILQEILNARKNLALPKVDGRDLVFKKITSLSDLELGNFSVMEPKDRCTLTNDLDAILIPAIAITRDGYRLGYGFGFYDRFLKNKKFKKISLAYQKQILKSIPFDDNDIKVDCIVTEDEIIYT